MLNLLAFISQKTPETSLEEYQRRLILYRKWKKDPNSIKALSKKGTKILPDGLKIHVSTDFSTRPSNFSNIPLNSLLMFKINHQDNCGVKEICEENERPGNTDGFYGKETLTKDGRFLISPFYCYGKNKTFVTITDLFCWTKRTTPVYIKIHTDTETTIINKRFLFLKSVDTLRLHIFQINYDDLSLEIFNFSSDSIFLHGKILCDHQMDEEKFMLFNNSQFYDCQIQNNEIDINDVKSFERVRRICGKRLFGNKLHGFICGNSWALLKFCELNLDTKDRMETNAGIDLDSVEIHEQHTFPNPYCWSNDYFCGMFQLKDDTYQLLAFDSKTLKWTDVKIFSQSPIRMFIDENEMMTLQVGNYSTPKAYYRIALRKPDKLMNLTRLAATRESSVYGNDKYVEISRKIDF